MLKSLTFGLSLTLALGLSSVSMAGHLHGLTSPQGPVVSHQGPIASPQVADCGGGCGGLGFLEKCGGLMTGFGHKCGGLMTGFGHKCGDMFTGAGHNFTHLCSKLKPKPKVYTYEWVLKKKKVHQPLCAPACETVYPSSQVMPAPQGVVTPAPQAYGSGQAYAAPVSATYGSGQLTPSTYGTSQYSPSAPAAPAAPAMGDEAPPAPEVAPAAPAPTIPPTSSLLFSTPSRN